MTVARTGWVCSMVNLLGSGYAKAGPQTPWREEGLGLRSHDPRHRD